MAKTEEIPASNDTTLLSLISSLQGLTLALQANMAGTTAQQAKPPPATATTVSTSTTVPAATSTTIPAVTALVVPAAAAPVLPAAATPAPPAVTTAPTNSTPTVATGGVPPTPPGPNPPPAAIGTLAAVYLTLSSQGVHPTVLEALPNIVSAPEFGPWFAVTVGRYTGVYSEWPEVSPIVSGWSGACYKRYSMKSAAFASYDHAWIRGLVHGDIHPDHHL